MQSRKLPAFDKALAKLNDETRSRAAKAYRLWSENPNHPSLHFKRVSTGQDVWSVRIDINCRALGLRKNDTIYWFWIGDHAEYDRLLRSL